VLILPVSIKCSIYGIIPLAAALARITAEPARVLGIDAGHLAAGAAADVCIVAIDEAWTVTRDALQSLGKNTPFLGLELAGRVRYTLVDGQIVYESAARGPTA
jgi:dihydroorotase